jgi:hypothetical protein
MGEQLYPDAKAVLRKPATEFLSEAQEDLKERGLSWKSSTAIAPTA